MLLRAQVQSLLRELRAHGLGSAAPKKVNIKFFARAFVLVFCLIGGLPHRLSVEGLVSFG